MKRFVLIPMLLSLLLATNLRAEKTFAERLGWKPNDVVVILHVDDMGMSHSSNLGGNRGAGKRRGDFVERDDALPLGARDRQVLEATPGRGQRPALDAYLGVEPLSLAAAGRQNQGSRLGDAEGCLWNEVQQVASHATPDEIETEIRAQLDRAEQLGIPITHLDSHMGTLFGPA